MVIGNSPSLPHSLISPGATLGSAIVNQFAEAAPGIGTSSVIALAGVLLVLTLLVNAGGQALLRGMAPGRRIRRGGDALSGPPGSRKRPGPLGPTSPKAADPALTGQPRGAGARS